MISLVRALCGKKIFCQIMATFYNSVSKIKFNESKH
jgi:hypothetical protein